MRIPKASYFKTAVGVVAYIAAVVVFFAAVVGVTHFTGKVLTPTVLHHEQENAHCYTAGKMFFVSIACVPKS